MEYYQVKIRLNNERVGIGYNYKTGEVWIGCYSRILKHATYVTFKFLKIPEQDLLERTGPRQRNRYRYYAKITDWHFREGLKRLLYRYEVLPCDKFIHKFT